MESISLRTPWGGQSGIPASKSSSSAFVWGSAASIWACVTVALANCRPAAPVGAMGLNSTLPSSYASVFISWCAWHCERRFSRFVPPMNKSQRSASSLPVIKARRWSTVVAGRSQPNVSQIGSRLNFIRRTPFTPFQTWRLYHGFGAFGFFISAPPAVPVLVAVAGRTRLGTGAGRGRALSPLLWLPVSAV